MFFAIDLLVPQHGGRFSVAWIAATRGVRFISKKQIAQCDINKLCDEILEMIQSSSTRPRFRLSLSLASRLVNGVIKIYRCQVEIATAELQGFLLQIRMPRTVSNSVEESEGTSRTPVPKGKRKRKHKNVIQLSDEPAAVPTVLTAAQIEEFLDPRIVIDEADLARPPVQQADPDLITIREEHPIGHHEERDFGDFGILDDVEPPVFTGVLLQDAPPLLPQTVLATPTKRKAQDAGETPAKKRAITMAKVVPAEAEIQPAPEEPPQLHIQVVSDKQPPEICVMHSPEEVPQVEAQPAAISLTEEQPAVKERVLDHCKATLNKRKRRFVNINRYMQNGMELFDLHRYKNRSPVELVEPTIEDVEVYEIIACFMQENETFDGFVRDLCISTRTRDSLLRSASLASIELRKRVTLTAPDTTLLASLLAKPVTVQTPVPLEPHQIIVQADVHVPTVPGEPTSLAEPQMPMQESERLELPEKTVKPLAESTGISFPVDVSAQPPEITIETAALPAAEAARLKKPVVMNLTLAEIKKTASRDRQKRIRSIVKHWNTEEQGEITIEDVCYKPVNRFNIALAFNDLLSLHKMGYVKLNNIPDSLELGTVEKGEQLLKRH